MANLYVSDDLHAAYIEAYGREDAKDAMREVLDANAPNGGGAE